ncbi:serine hydrolase domain-containing protein [Stenotrophomonas rhizophila]|uniref:serine hydrolase domain-containing protein n=1 Tax=Stenotrophomonas rhizophila TaxID=216778 RepID=UPI001E3BEF2F|nr:serine hydrolase domain-containing protein [Stenotrophomonas rhizophila]MCC7634827.1 serine hydrolase [Stenotrophomonas rhizophila]MCC7664500.1 serine hydrolase [Stenotrophomonas rhizophila]
MDTLRRRLLAGTAAGWLAQSLPVPVKAGSTADRAGLADANAPASSAIDAVLADGQAIDGLRSLLLAAGGKVLGERYYHGAQAEDLQPVNSITKSVTSMLVGLALRRGSLPGLSARVAQLLPRARACVAPCPAAQLHLEQLLNARSGLRYDWLAQYDALMASPDPIAMALAQVAEPGAAGQWSYNDPVIGLLSPILAEAEGLDLEALAARELFAPLGIGHWHWQRDALGQPMSYAGLALRSRDLLKLVWMMAREGRWGTAPILPARWVRASTRSRGTAQWQLPGLHDIGYGYLWFSGRLDRQRLVWGWGYGGQFALWAPAHGIAVVSTATAPEPARALPQAEAIMALVLRLLRLPLQTRPQRCRRAGPGSAPSRPCARP